MEIKEGGYYKNRLGEKVGPAKLPDEDDYNAVNKGWFAFDQYKWYVSKDGKHLSNTIEKSDRDLIEEWNEMEIKEGCFYKNRKGNKVGPIVRFDDNVYKTASFTDGGWTYTKTGKWAGDKMDNEKDLIEEWIERIPVAKTAVKNPIKEVVTRELEPGQYGRLHIEDNLNNTYVKMSMCGKSGETYGAVVHALNSEELREMAHVLNQLAEFLEDQKNE